MEIEDLLKKLKRTSISVKTACRFFHSWGRWEDCDRFNITETRGDVKKTTGYLVLQERRCKDCHMLQTRQERKDFFR